MGVCNTQRQTSLLIPSLSYFFVTAGSLAPLFPSQPNFLYFLLWPPHLTNTDAAVERDADCVGNYESEAEDIMG